MGFTRTVTSLLPFEKRSKGQLAGERHVETGMPSCTCSVGLPSYPSSWSYPVLVRFLVRLFSHMSMGIPFGKTFWQYVLRAIKRPVPRDLVITLWNVSYGNDSEEVLCCHEI